eukprot:759003-Hanusia_phi.AAC.1
MTSAEEEELDWRRRGGSNVQAQEQSRSSEARQGEAEVKRPGGVGCLTVLVRCAVVADNVEQNAAGAVRDPRAISLPPLSPAPGLPPLQHYQRPRLSPWLALADERGLPVEQQARGRDKPGGGGNADAEEGGSKKRWFRMTQVKNRFHSSSHYFNHGLPRPLPQPRSRLDL